MDGGDDARGTVLLLPSLGKISVPAVGCAGGLCDGGRESLESVSMPGGGTGLDGGGDLSPSGGTVSPETPSSSSPWSSRDMAMAFAYEEYVEGRV